MRQSKREKLVFKKTFSELDALAFIRETLEPLTRGYSTQVEALIATLDSLPAGVGDAPVDALENEVNALIDDWQKAVAALDCVPEGLWIVDLYAGADVFCWKYGDAAETLYRNSLGVGFAKRQRVDTSLRAIVRLAAAQGRAS